MLRRLMQNSFRILPKNLSKFSTVSGFSSNVSAHNYPASFSLADFSRIFVSCNHVFYFFNGMGFVNAPNQIRHFQASAASFDKTNTGDRVKDPSLAWTRDGKTYDKGPDQILPSTSVRTWYPDGAVKICIEDREMAYRTPLSVPSLLKRCADRCPNQIAMKIKENNKWKTWSFKEYLNDARTCAKGFIALGLERYHSVAILGFNSPEWFISDMGAIFAGGFAVGMYTTNLPEACAYIALDSRSNIIVVEDETQLEKIFNIRGELPDLKAIVQYSGKPSAKGILSWGDLMELGRQQKDDVLDSRLKNIAINQCCTLVYTSGTTGKPKGTMLSHDNVTWMAHVSKHWAGFRNCTESFQETAISFLPLSHVAAQMADMYCTLAVCGCVAFADKMALKGTLLENMKEVLPTKYLAVPRVWESFHEKITEVGRNTKGVERIVATWAKNQALLHYQKKISGEADSESLGFKVANRLVLSKVKDALGLSRCDLFLSGAAPLSPDIIKFFLSLGIVVTEAYGLSESSGPHTMAIPNSFRIGSVGRTMVGCKTKISNPDADGRGEILMGGRHVTMGYLHQEEKTKAAVDEEGWMHSEDLGAVDEDGFLFITGRLKEILITAGGENVAPVPIEDRIKSEIPAISQAVVIGDKLKFLSVLLTLKTEFDPDTQEPLNKLLPGCKDWIEKNGDCTVNTTQDIHRELNGNNNKTLLKAIEDAMSRVNEHSVSNAAKVKKWIILNSDFSIPGGEIGPSLKLKRKVIYEKYKEEIAKLYQ